MVIVTLIASVTGLIIYLNKQKTQFLLMEEQIRNSKIEQIQPQVYTPSPTEPVIAAASPVPLENNQKGKIVVLDAGHGKDSGSMSGEEKESEGYEYSEERGGWGEWRHYKNGTFGEDCHGGGCTETGVSCWYSMGEGDRNEEPQIDLNNALAAKGYLEEMGYEVRMTRTSNEENPSMSKRVAKCFPNGDTASEPDADLYVCIHSNAADGNTSGTSYIALEGEYTQSHIKDDFVFASNEAGSIINSKIAEETSLTSNGSISGMGYLILFNKCPVPIAYLEIGFFDNASDLNILNSESNAIGKAIADGVNQYLGGAY